MCVRPTRETEEALGWRERLKVAGCHPILAPISGIVLLAVSGAHKNDDGSSYSQKDVARE